MSRAGTLTYYAALVVIAAAPLLPVAARWRVRAMLAGIVGLVAILVAR